jgi:hypothetical protein
LASAALLTACGGGGGDSGASSPTPTATLSGANQETVAQDTAATAFMPMQGAQVLGGAAVTDDGVVFAIAREQLGKLSTYMAQAKSENLMGAAVASLTVSCSSGSLTVAVTDADNNSQISAGDSLTVTSNTCVMPSGTVSGTLGFQINSLSGTSTTNYSMGATMSFGNFTVTDTVRQFTVSANGSLTVNFNTTAVHTWTETVSTPSMTVSGSYLGMTRSRTLSNYSASATRAPHANYTYQTRYTLSGAVTTSALGNQTFLFATTTEFVKNGIDAYPSSGEMLITGANNGKLKVTAMDNTQVNLALDADGNGTYDSPVTVSWSALY